MVGGGSFCQNLGWSHVLKKLQVGNPKFREVPLELKLHHPSGPIDIGLERVDPLSSHE